MSIRNEKMSAAYIAALCILRPPGIRKDKTMNDQIQTPEEKKPAEQKAPGYPLYCDLTKHSLLLLFTVIWYYVWIYRTTSYLNRAGEYRDAKKKLLLCFFVPFYAVYWAYRSAQRVTELEGTNDKEFPKACIWLSIFIPIVTPILMQDRINRIIEQTEPEAKNSESSRRLIEHTRSLAECAVLIALATVLSLIKIPIGHLGGSVTLLSALPLVIICYRRGVKWGFASAFIYSLIHIIVRVSTVAVLFVPDKSGLQWYGALLSILLDYIVAFTVIGTASFFRRIKVPGVALGVGAGVGLTLRYVSHFLSGIILYSAWATWYFDAAEEDSFASQGGVAAKIGEWVLNTFKTPSGLGAFYSAFYNGLFMIPEIILTVAGAVAVSFIPFVVNKNKKV